MSDRNKILRDKFFGATPTTTRTNAKTTTVSSFSSPSNSRPTYQLTTTNKLTSSPASNQRRSSYQRDAYEPPSNVPRRSNSFRMNERYSNTSSTTRVHSTKTTSESKYNTSTSLSVKRNGTTINDYNTNRLFEYATDNSSSINRPAFESSFAKKQHLPEFATKNIFYSFKDSKSNKPTTTNTNPTTSSSTTKSIAPLLSVPKPIQSGIGPTITKPNNDALGFKSNTPIPIRPQKYTTNHITIPTKSDQQKGYAFILNHENYRNDPTGSKKRKGTEHDVKLLNLTLSNYNLKVAQYDDLTKDEIKSLVEKLKLHDFKKDLCVIFVILTHGKENNILLAADQKEYNLFDFFIHEIVNSNKTLVKKPKMCFVQACKGSNEYATLRRDGPSTSVIQKSQNQEDDIYHPAITELFVCFATYEGHYANRYEEFGTPFIQEFCKMLDRRGMYKSINEIIIDVTNAIVSRKDIIQVPTTYSTMTSSFYFKRLKS